MYLFMKVFTEILSPEWQGSSIIVCFIVAHSPGVIHELAVPPAGYKKEMMRWDTTFPHPYLHPPLPAQPLQLTMHDLK